MNFRIVLELLLYAAAVYFFGWWGLAGVVAHIVYRWNAAKRAHALHHEMFDLRYPDLDVSGLYDSHDTFRCYLYADLKRMVMVFEKSDVGYHSVKIDHLRRRDSATWEIQEEYESWKRSLRDAEANQFTDEEELKKLREGPKWSMLENAEIASPLELAYQRFIAHFKETGTLKERVDLSLSRIKDRAQERKALASSPDLREDHGHP